MIKRQVLQHHRTPGGLPMAISIRLTRKGEFIKGVAYRATNGEWYPWDIKKEFGPGVFSESAGVRKKLTEQLHDRYGASSEYQALAMQVVKDLEKSVAQL